MSHEVEEGTFEIEDVSGLYLTKGGALICRFHADDEKARSIPVKVIHENSEVWKPGQRGTLVVMEWFAIKEGLA